MTTPATAHFRIAWNAYRIHWRVFLLAMLVLFASWVALELAVVSLQRFGVVPNVLLHAGFLILFSGLMVGTHSMALDAVNGRTPHKRQLTASLGKGAVYLFALSLYFVATVAGLMLLVAPGIYIAARYALFGQVIASGRGTALGALREARALTSGRWPASARVLLTALAINCAGAALLGLGLVVSFPVSLLAAASLFRTLKPAPVVERALAGTA